MSSILAFIFVFGILVFVHEFGHFLLAKRNGVEVQRFSFGFGPKLLGKKIGNTEYVISAVPLGGYVKMVGDEPGRERKGASSEFLSKSCGQRAQIVAAGPILNYLLAFFIFSLIFIIGSPTITTRVGKLLDDYPAKQAGVKEDDIILAVDAEKVEYWQDMVEIIHSKTTNAAIVLDIKRGEQLLQISLNPLIKESEDIFGEKRRIGLVGIYPSEETTEIRYGWGKSFYKGAERLLALTRLTYKSLWFMLTRRLSVRDSLTGPIGIFYFTGKVAKLGFVYLLSFMGLLSMSLAIFNFLPVPVLDGGHLFFLLLERLRKRPVSIRIQELAAKAGMIFLISLMLFVIYNDLARFEVWDKIVQWCNSWGRD